MGSPYFYFAHLATMADEFALNENSSRHIVQVLRMQPGEILRLTDGKGLSVNAEIREAHKKKCIVRILERQTTRKADRSIHIGISLLKNTSRFEWFLEKAAELGITEITPLRCARTEKQQFRLDRMQGILESALIQSQQVWMTVIGEPQSFSQLVTASWAEQRYIAHCEEGPKKKLSEVVCDSAVASSRLLLIGPEGDFSPEEIQLAEANQFLPVALGSTRLRSETAALAAAAVLTLL
jgi:16S rRNA (uracil1498-N3)-methyltransferase